jgi:hypothetical protein
MLAESVPMLMVGGVSRDFSLHGFRQFFEQKSCGIYGGVASDRLVILPVTLRFGGSLLAPSFV